MTVDVGGDTKPFMFFFNTIDVGVIRYLEIVPSGTDLGLDNPGWCCNRTRRVHVYE